MEYVGRRAVDESEEHLASSSREACGMSGLFPNALHVARREYLVRVRGRAFAITTALLAIAIAAVTMVPTILTAVGVADPPQIAVDVQAEDLRGRPGAPAAAGAHRPRAGLIPTPRTRIAHA